MPTPTFLWVFTGIATLSDTNGDGTKDRATITKDHGGGVVHTVDFKYDATLERLTDVAEVDVINGPTIPDPPGTEPCTVWVREGHFPAAYKTSNLYDKVSARLFHRHEVQVDSGASAKPEVDVRARFKVITTPGTSTGKNTTLSLARGVYRLDAEVFTVDVALGSANPKYVYISEEELEQLDITPSGTSMAVGHRFYSFPPYPSDASLFAEVVRVRGKSRVDLRVKNETEDTWVVVTVDLDDPDQAAGLKLAPAGQQIKARRGSKGYLAMSEWFCRAHDLWPLPTNSETTSIKYPAKEGVK